MSCAVHAGGLRFRYPNGVVGLDGVDLHVTHGERVAVLGPNGAGKTTLMLHLNALLTGEGELEVAGLRVAIAAVLAMHPSLLVLDEPSANLDPRTRRELIELLDRVERTMLVVTHDLPLAATLCERAVVLSGGRIVADGSCPDILADAELLAAHDLELPDGFDLSRLRLRAPADPWR